MGQFLPQVQIPADHPRGEIIRWAAACLYTLPAYKTRSDYIEHRIWTLVSMNVDNVTHHVEAVAKCSTIRLGVSDECFTYCNAGALTWMSAPSQATHASSNGLPPTGIDYGNGLKFCITNNVRIICKSKNGHCYIWTIVEGKWWLVLIVYIHMIISWKITCEYFNLGRTRASDAFFNAKHVELGFHSSAEVWCKPGWPKTLEHNILRFFTMTLFCSGTPILQEPRHFRSCSL